MQCLKYIVRNLNSISKWKCWTDRISSNTIVIADPIKRRKLCTCDIYIRRLLDNDKSALPIRSNNISLQNYVMSS